MHIKKAKYRIGHINQPRYNGCLQTDPDMADCSQFTPESNEID